MKRTFIYSTAIVALFATAAPVANATDKTRDQGRLQAQDRVYGSQLMTRQERNEYGALMNAARTGKERDQIRQAHQEQMQERAKQRGMTLPDEAPAYGKTQDMGSGGGMGGPGSGVGPGSRRMK
jgi:1,2-phenylacetyl-CoA epoxidase catalytic subunit